MASCTQESDPGKTEGDKCRDPVPMAAVAIDTLAEKSEACACLLAFSLLVLPTFKAVSLD